MRTYTFKQVAPLLQEHQARIDTFLAQTVPAYAATGAFNYLHCDYGDYTYKEATLNSTNLRDRAVDWEADVIEVFLSRRNFPESATHLLDERCSWPRSCRLRRWWGL